MRSEASNPQGQDDPRDGDCKGTRRPTLKVKMSVVKKTAVQFPPSSLFFTGVATWSLVASQLREVRKEPRYSLMGIPWAKE